MTPSRVRIVEVGPRDGLQNEAGLIGVEEKAEFVNALARAGLREIEAGAFVSPKWAPQMANSGEVFARIERLPGVRYTALVPNPKGMERAIASAVSGVAVFTAASEAFAKKNINMTIAESISSFAKVMEMARAHQLPVRGYVSTCWVCPYAGPVAPEAVLDVTRRLLDLGCHEVSLGDTIGAATPGGVEKLLGLLLQHIPAGALAVHFHDTRGLAAANVLQSLRMGVATVDASAGGLGGCPYAPGASGNLATEDLAYMLHGMGIETGINLDALTETSIRMARLLGRPPISRYVQAAVGARQRAAAQQESSS